MPRPFPLKASLTQRAPITFAQAQDDVSILSALPFFPDHELEDAMDCFEADPSNEARWALGTALGSSLDGIDLTTGWRGSRASQDRSYGSNLDKAMILSKKVRRLTARIPAGPIRGYEAEYATVAAYLEDHPCDLSTTEALLHAEERSRYKIGQGLLDAASGMTESGLLSEAKIFYGSGMNQPERLLIRDAVFAAEDQTLEDMLGILVGTPNAVDEIYDDTADTTYRDNKIETGVTPLIFVNCIGTFKDRHGRREVILEAVDFGSVDTLRHFKDAMSNRTQKVISDFQETMIALAGR